MRLFIAINLPEDTRRALYDAAAPLRATDAPVKWVAPDAIHMTLKFLGGVNDDLEPSITKWLDTVAAERRPFALSLDGFGAFPAVDHPRVIWAGAESVPPLELLQHDVETAMADLGFEVEGRPFKPHVTLGRMKKGGEREARALGDLLGALEFADEVAVETVDLMRSRTLPDGAQYAVRHSARLGGA